MRRDVPRLNQSPGSIPGDATRTAGATVPYDQVAFPATHGLDADGVDAQPGEGLGAARSHRMTSKQLSIAGWAQCWLAHPGGKLHNGSDGSYLAESLSIPVREEWHGVGIHATSTT